MIPTECQEWIVDTVPGARFATVAADAEGSHFAFWENPDRFSDLVGNFLAATGGC